MTEPAFRENRRQRAERAAAAASRAEIEGLLPDHSAEVLLALARNPRLEERDLLRLLARHDLPHEVVQELARRPDIGRTYALQLALVKHPKAPRQVSLPLMKFLYLFDLLRVAQTPAVPADVKMAAEQNILKKLAGLPHGEQISLARRGTGRLASSLLLLPHLDVIRAALDNPYLTEGHLLKVLARDDLPTAVVEELTHHGRWSHHYYLRLALVRNPLTPLARVLAFLPDMAVADLRDICLDHRMPPPVRKYIEAHCAERLRKQRQLRVSQNLSPDEPV